MARFRWPFSSDRESFNASWSIGDPAFAAWIRGGEAVGEPVTPYTVLGLAAVQRALQVIAGTIAGLPLRTYERQGTEKIRIPSVYDDPFPGEGGQTPFAWVETILWHQLLWTNTYLWHEARDSRSGEVTAYRPLVPDAIEKVERRSGRKFFTYRDTDGQAHEVGSEWITHIPGPSIDGVSGYPLLIAARAIFSGALAGDKAAQQTLSRGIRLAGLVTPAEGEEIDEGEAEQILVKLRERVLGQENAGDLALINRRLEMKPWAPTNIESQWTETRNYWLGEAGRLFGVPPHLLNDTEKQTSWGTGVAEQTLNFARHTLMGHTSRIEQVLSRNLPDGQFCEFDYKGLLQGTPAEEGDLLLKYVGAQVMTRDEARKVLNLPPLTPAQKAELAPPPAPPTAPEVPA